MLDPCPKLDAAQ
jgi:hypothetical protein